MTRRTPSPGGGAIAHECPDSASLGARRGFYHALQASVGGTLEAGASMADFPDGELGDAAELGAISDRVVRVWLRQPGADEARVSLQVAGHAAVTGTMPLSAA